MEATLAPGESEPFGLLPDPEDVHECFQALNIDFFYLKIVYLRSHCDGFARSQGWRSVGNGGDPEGLWSDGSHSVSGEDVQVAL